MKAKPIDIMPYSLGSSWFFILESFLCLVPCALCLVTPIFVAKTKTNHAKKIVRFTSHHSAMYQFFAEQPGSFNSRKNNAGPKMDWYFAFRRLLVRRWKVPPLQLEPGRCSLRFYILYHPCGSQSGEINFFISE